MAFSLFTGNYPFRVIGLEVGRWKGSESMCDLFDKNEKKKNQKHTTFTLKENMPHTKSEKKEESIDRKRKQN